MRRFGRAILAASALLVAFGGAAMAQRDRDEHWRGDIGGFRGHDLDRWRGGNWFHGRHGGRAGWWWVVGSQWYFYPAPVYPYPDPYLPPVTAPAPVASWYYCASPRGYYPYVPQCALPWQPVPVPPQ